RESDTLSPASHRRARRGHARWPSLSCPYPTCHRHGPLDPWESPFMRVRILVPLAVLVVSAAARNASALTLDREVRIDPKRVTVSIAKGVATVDAKGATREYRAGQPDLPWISERIDLPA